MILSKADVSVVIPCYNSESTISRAVDSVLCQTLSPNEIIIVDDASTDDTSIVVGNIIKLNPTVKIHYYRLQNNFGPSTARNFGWNASSSRYVAFLDADDTWDLKKIEFQYIFMHKNSCVDVSGYALNFDDSMNSLDDIRCDQWRILFLHNFLVKNCFCTSSVMLKKNIKFRFDIKKRYSEDYALWLSMVASGLFVVFLPVKLSYYYKAEYGESGLSAHMVKMWSGEMSAFFELWKNKSISLIILTFFIGFSSLKFFKRILVTLYRRVTN
jgi:glycosyltransferase involved in cell wall biosynthesis